MKSTYAGALHASAVGSNLACMASSPQTYTAGCSAASLAQKAVAACPAGSVCQDADCLTVPRHWTCQQILQMCQQVCQICPLQDLLLAPCKGFCQVLHPVHDSMQWLLSADTLQLNPAVTAAHEYCSASSCAAGSKHVVGHAAAQGIAVACCQPAAVLVIGTTAGKPEAHSIPVYHHSLYHSESKVSSSKLQVASK